MTQANNKTTDYVVNGGTIENEGSYSINTEGAKTFDAGTWYTVKLDVDTNTRNVAYTVTAYGASTPFVEGTLNVPETNVKDGSEVSMLAEGIHALMARYWTILAFDNIKIYVESDDDVANAPTITLSRVGTNADESEKLEMRAYTISFSEGETLHVTGTDGTTTDVTYASCNGSYLYETTTSGTLTAWTTLGTATSEEVEETVDCSVIELPRATVSISGISEGYGKTYSLTLDNSDILLRPEITISYEFIGDSGKKVTGTGNSVTVTENGTLEVNASASGYKKSSTSIDNNIYYTVKKTWDFARMSKEDIVAAGFPEEFSKYDNSSKWVSNGNLYYGNKIRPFSEIEYSLIDNSAAESVEKDQYFKDLTVFPKTSKGCPNVGMMYHIGLFNNQTTNNNNDIIVHNLDKSDIVIFNVIGSYGGNSCHPDVSTAEEYYALLAGEDHLYTVTSSGVKEASESENPTYSVTYPLYRIDSACTLITVYKESDPNVKEDVATAPKVELVRVGTDASGNENLELRAYKITFLEGETLHVTGPDDNTVTVEYTTENEGVYEYEATTSGTLIAWTTSGKATSDEVSRTVDCNPIALPEVKVSITSISEGYGKTYNITVDNQNVPLQPEISVSYVFTDKNDKKVEGSESTITVSEEGTLVVTTSAKGYQSTNTTVENSNYYAVKKMWDFARMSDEEISAAGFPADYEILNSGSTSGFNNWTARKRLYYTNSDATVYPFGYVSADSSNVIEYTTIGSATNTAGNELFPGITVYAGHNVRYMKHIGMVNDETGGGNNKNIDVLDLDANDVVVFNIINSYGGNSNHPECASDEEYFAQLAGDNSFYNASEGTLNSETGKYTVSCPVYRIENAVTNVSVYSEVDLTADYTYTLVYVNELNGETIKTVERTGKFGSAIEVSEAETADFELDRVKYVVASNDSEGKTITLIGTTVKVVCNAVADYTLEYVCGDKVLKTETVNGVVGADIEISDEEKADIKDNDVTYLYVSDDAEGKTVTLEGTKVTLTYEKQVIPVSSITIKAIENNGLVKDESITLEATVLPANATDAAITWTSSNPDVATVDAEGNVTAVGVGNVTITAKAGEKSAECAIKCYPQKGDATWKDGISVADAIDIANYVLEDKEIPADWDKDEWLEFYTKAADVNEDKNITISDASATVSLVLEQNNSASQVRTLSASANDEATDNLVIGGMTTTSNGETSIAVTLDNSMDYVAVQADIYVPEGVSFDVKAGSRIANSHSFQTKRFDDNHMRVVIYTFSGNAFADNNEPLFEIIADSYLASQNDITLVNILASDAKAHEYALGSKYAGTTGVEALGFDSNAPVKVFDLNGRYVSDKVEGLEKGIYIISQGNNAKKVNIR